ncbi:MAG: hypothetical protein JRI23_35970 [Deltaproteobacteria bacterium]|jgi:hypothetical protein|nr:hypothetical protein [Deltaproteobacteria bacterium]MBW2537747.1 hypothetical protein [Deltaproteobacteria bacterium]
MGRQKTTVGRGSRPAAALTALAMLLHTSGALAEPCASSDDCVGDETCDEGECVAPATTDEKAADDDAPDDEKADEGASSTSDDGDAQGYPGMIGAGIGLLGVGVFGVGVGIGAILGGASTGHDYVADAANASANPNEQGFPETSDPGLQIAGGILLGLSGAMAITGAILIPVGMNSDPPPADGAFVVEPLVGPTHAGLRVRF